jgi:glucose-6-phosphate isomerase/transaldolase/glucose-6-phosphate isomerase
MPSTAERLRAKDTTLWPEGGVAANRLGWVDIADRFLADGTADDLQSWAATITQPRIVLLGMGGSSLGPEVLRAFAGSDRLVVLDTTDPRTIATTELDDAFFLVSSKSGGTLEVQTLLAHAWAHVPDGSRYAAITDPDTSLAALAAERGFARTFTNPADIGGRYSVLSLFGLVPAALLGYDVGELLRRATSVDWAEAAALGDAMGHAALEGRDKVTIRTAPTAAAFGLWVEQLIAESTGKSGKGCVPVPTTEAEDGDDRFPVSVQLGDALDLGAEFLRWEIATAVAGSVLGIDPFDEPNVTESKENTKRVLDALPLPEWELEDPSGALDWVASEFEDGDYVSIQAYLPYDEGDALEALRRKVRDRLRGAPVTAGYGPRFLHSTGQLHKGGANNVIALQIVPRQPTAKLDIPGFPYDFGTLIAAQALGDHQSLVEHGRRVLRIGADHLGEVG